MGLVPGQGDPLGWDDDPVGRLDPRCHHSRPFGDLVESPLLPPQGRAPDPDVWSACDRQVEGVTVPSGPLTEHLPLVSSELDERVRVDQLVVAAWGRASGDVRGVGLGPAVVPVGVFGAVGAMHDDRAGDCGFALPVELAARWGMVFEVDAHESFGSDGVLHKSGPNGPAWSNDAKPS